MVRQWPHTSAQQDKLIEEAIRFIQKVQQESEHGFAMDVGRHLFENLFKSDLNLLRSTSRWKSQAISRIADDDRADLSEDEIGACCKTYILVTRFQRHKSPEPPHLSRWKWAKMWDLVDDPQTLFSIAEWVHRREAPNHLIRTVVQTIHPYIAAGGKLNDLLVDPTLISGEDTPYQRSSRLLRIERKWFSTGPPVPPETRLELLDLLDRIEKILLQ